VSASPRSQAAGPPKRWHAAWSDDPRELKRQSRRHRLAAGHAPSARDQQSPSTDARSTRRSPRASNSAVSHARHSSQRTPPSQRARSPRAEHGRSARSPRATATAQTPASCRPLDAPTCRTSVTVTTGRHHRSHAQLPPGGCPRRGWSFHDFVRLLRSQRVRSAAATAAPTTCQHVEPRQPRGGFGSWYYS
jgi:hypothetical protein